MSKIVEVNNNVDKTKLQDTGEKEGEAEEEEEEEKENVYDLDGCVEILVTAAEEWLCVSRLPVDVTEDEFKKLVEEYGPTKRTLIIRSKRTGKEIELFEKLMQE